jgi:WD40 repeat protein
VAGPAADNLSELRGVFRASFNHDGSRVVVRGREGAVTVWELPMGTPIVGDLDPEAESDGFLMSADGKLVAISFKDGRCRVFDPATAKAISPPLDFRLNAEFAMPGLFSPDGNTLLLFSANEAVVFEIRTAKKLATISLGGDAESESSRDSSGSAAFAAEAAQCFVIDTRGNVTRYDTKTWKAVGKPMHHPSDEFANEFGFNVSEDGKWLVTYDDPGENGPKSHLQAWDASATKALGKPVTEVNGLSGRFLGNNRLLVVPGRGEATVRELPSMKVVYSLAKHDDIDAPRAEISPDRKWILAWGADKRLDLVEVATGKVIGNYAGAAVISKVIMAPDSASCYVVFEGANDQSMVKLDIPGLKPAQTLSIPDFVLDVSVARDGKRLMLQHGGSDQERVDFYDAATLKPLEERQ